MSESIQTRAANVRLAIFDVDGVMTDGKLYLGPNGQELKTMSVRDGLGLKLLQQAGVEIAVISGRPSQAVIVRLNALGITRIHMHVKDKVPFYEQLLADLGISDAQVAYMGDDSPDVPVMQRVGLSMTVADAHKSAGLFAHWTSQGAVGHGAVREACDMIVEAQA
ncbi:HAD-IIIA family hydrolase [bacterium]|nr:HAD-IIIA family hydrolase [bacterium]